ncbi:MAG TPA: cyanophycin synthetase, partial [Pirellulales bacterium]|nr:cyanophycin synthetase [Pirellulales bacterium]
AGCYEFTIKHGNRWIGRLALRVAGRHNVLNAVAAAALAYRGGASPDDIIRCLAEFRGLGRRLQHLGEHAGVHVWDDFAHHPTAMSVTLAALREVHPNSRLWCVFQPHQALRTRHLMDEFARSLQNADVVAVAPVYRAREGEWQPGEPTAADLATVVRSFGTKTMICDTLDQIQQQLTCCPGDVLVTLGAGNISKISHDFANRI